MIKTLDYNYIWCWKTENYPDEIKNIFWVYHLNLGLDRWRLKRKSLKKSS